MKPFLRSCFVLMALVISGCKHPSTPAASTSTTEPPYKKPATFDVQGSHTLGKVDRLDPRLDELIAPGSKMEKLAEGFDWSEGPIWMKTGDFLLFSDVPQNVVYRWKEGEGVKEFLKPSGYTDRKSTRLNSSHGYISYAVFCLKKKKTTSSSRFIPMTSHTHR